MPISSSLGPLSLSGDEETDLLRSVCVKMTKPRNMVMYLRCFVSGLCLALVIWMAMMAPATAIGVSETTAQPEAASQPSRAYGCYADSDKNTDYITCRFNPAVHDIRLFLNNADGEPYSHFNWVDEALAGEDARLAFAMNAGMYHEDRAPVGLYTEKGVELAPLNDNDGPGNFHLKPNGVFLILAEDGHRGAHVLTSEAYTDKMDHDVVAYATQSGPMLVIDGEVHPRFRPASDSLKRRNGVGVTAAGDVIFAIADDPVRFYDFAAYFRDVLKTPNALYLDGTISRLYAPALDRNDPGAAMGPIVGVVVKDD